MNAINKLLSWCEYWDNYLEKKNNDLNYLSTKDKNVGNANYNIFAYNLDTKFPTWFNGKKNGYAWCTSFCGDGLCENFGEEMSHKITGIPLKSMAAVVPYWRNYMDSIGRVYSHPAPGDFVTFGDQHIGIVRSVTSNTKFTTWEGNTGNTNNKVQSDGGGVHSKSYTLTSSMKFCRPLWNLIDQDYVDPITILQYGDKNISVKDLQSKLVQLGYNTNGVDSKYGNGTKSAVIKFQQDYKLSADGVAGKQTITKLNELTSISIEKNVVVKSYLSKGDSGTKVEQLQKDLALLGYYTYNITGIFDDNTNTAVGLFQADHGLVVDYEYGKQSEQQMQICIKILNNKSFGIDVSIYQNNFDFTEALNSNVQFCIIRGGYTSSSGARNVDTSFINHYNKCKQNKIKTGVYYYSMAKSENDAVEEAKFLYNNCLKNRKFELPIYIDIENKVTLNLGKTKVTAIANAFINYLQKMNYVAGVYSSVSMFNSYFDMDSLTGEIWAASWGTTQPNIKNLGLWQFGGETNKIRYNKICNILVDQDLLLKDYSYIEKEKLNGFGVIIEQQYAEINIPIIQKGYKGVVAAMLQSALNYLGYNVGGIDGDVGTKTITKLKEWQTKNNLTSDGICKKTDWDKLINN